MGISTLYLHNIKTANRSHFPLAVFKFLGLMILVKFNVLLTVLYVK